MFLLVLAHPGCLVRIQKAVKQLCVCVRVWSGSFKSLAHLFCFFPFAMEITLFAFCLLFLYPFHASVNFSFSNFHTFSSFPYCFSIFLIPAPCFLMTAWIFSQSTCDLCCFHHYIFHLSPVFIYIKVFPLSFCYLIFDHAILHVFSFLCFHTCTPGSNFLCHLFVVLNHMSITNNLCFGIGTHSSFRMTLILQTFALPSCHTII